MRAVGSRDLSSVQEVGSKPTYKGARGPTVSRQTANPIDTEDSPQPKARAPPHHKKDVDLYQ